MLFVKYPCLWWFFFLQWILWRGVQDPHIHPRRSGEDDHRNGRWRYSKLFGTSTSDNGSIKVFLSGPARFLSNRNKRMRIGVVLCCVVLCLLCVHNLLNPESIYQVFVIVKWTYWKLKVAFLVVLYWLLKSIEVIEVCCFVVINNVWHQHWFMHCLLSGHFKARNVEMMHLNIKLMCIEFWKPPQNLGSSFFLIGYKCFQAKTCFMKS